MRFELEDKESDYLVSLLMQRPLGESMGLYLKLLAQVQQQQKAAQEAHTGPQRLANGAEVTEAHPAH